MEKTYQGTKGSVYTITQTPLASGGEGSIYSIKDMENTVLKIFKPERRTKGREEKLLKMVKYQLSTEQLQQVTWPQDVVYDQNGFVGYVMPRLWGNQNLNKVYAIQNNDLNLRHRMLIAYNLCAAIDTVHSLNQVCGDLNPQNICVNLNLQSQYALRVTLVDTDSYHITDDNNTYRCEVGLANYLAPEIQQKLVNGQDLKSMSLPSFTKETDLFALAVHVFALVMNGCHPFACAKQTNNGYENTMGVMNDKDSESVVLPQPIDNIKDGFFPFHQKKDGVTYPLYAPDFGLLPKEMQELFIRAFEDGYQNPKERPTTTEWLGVLKRYLSSSEFQQCEKKHYYYRNHENKCPYCEARQRMMKAMSGQSSPVKGNAGANATYHQNAYQQNPATPNPNTLNAQMPNPNNQKPKKGRNFISRAMVILTSVASLVLIVLLGFGLFQSEITAAVKNIKYDYYMNTAESKKENANYDEAITQYLNAVEQTEENLNKENAYIGVAECKALKGDYKGAIITINECKDKCNSSNTAFSDVYQIIENRDSNKNFGEIEDYLVKIIEQIKNNNFQKAFNLLMKLDKISETEVWYANGKLYLSGDGLSGQCLYVNASGDLYYGEMQSGVICGKGIQIGSYLSDDKVYYYVHGMFDNNYANGECTYFVSEHGTPEHKKYISGNFTYGYEDGVMERKVVWSDGESNHNQYEAALGTYSVLREKNGQYIYAEAEDGSPALSCENKKDLEGHRVPSIVKE